LEERPRRLRVGHHATALVADGRDAALDPLRDLVAQLGVEIRAPALGFVEPRQHVERTYGFLIERSSNSFVQRTYLRPQRGRAHFVLDRLDEELVVVG